MPITSWIRQLSSPHRLPAAGPAGRRAATLLLRVGSAALLAWIGYIHLHLWLEGYRQIPTDGPLFLLDAIAGFILAATLLAWPRPLAGLLAAGYAIVDTGALLISLSVGLFGFHESITASFVIPSLAIETILVAALLAWALLMPTGRPGRAGPPPEPQAGKDHAARHPELWHLSPGRPRHRGAAR